MDKAGVSAADIDLLVVGTYSPDSADSLDGLPNSAQAGAALRGVRCFGGLRGLHVCLGHGGAICRREDEQAGAGDWGRFAIRELSSRKTRKPIRSSATVPGRCFWPPATKIKG